MIERAHREAVASTIGRIEREVELVRGRVEGEVRHERARSVVAGEFVHTSSRLTRDQEQEGVPDPQLHSHVVVLGAERMDGRYAAVDSARCFWLARENGAWYRAELAHGLQQQGLEIEGQTGRDGRYFEVAGVPKELSERWSARSVISSVRRRGSATRYGRDPRAGELARSNDEHARHEGHVVAGRRERGVARGRRGAWSDERAGKEPVHRHRPEP